MIIKEAPYTENFLKRIRGLKAIHMNLILDLKELKNKEDLLGFNNYYLTLEKQDNKKIIVKAIIKTFFGSKEKEEKEQQEFLICLKELLRGKYSSIGQNIGELVDFKQKAYGDSITKANQLLKVYLQKYYNKKTKEYTIPEELLNHIAIMVRIIDKQNRIFNNPKQDLMNENPYKDIAGYGLLGSQMSDLDD